LLGFQGSPTQRAGGERWRSVRSRQTAQHLQHVNTTSAADGSERYVTEADELATIMTQGVGSGVATDRASMRAFLDDHRGDGPIRRYAWDESGELDSPEPLLHEVG
jgi:hypothetical protein